MADLPTTERYFSGETTRAVHTRIDNTNDRIARVNAELQVLAEKVEDIPKQTAENLARAFAEHEIREQQWHVKPEEVAEKVVENIWVMLLGEDMAKSPEAAKHKRTLQEVWRAAIKTAPYVFGWKMMIVMMFTAAILLGSATTVLDAIRRKLGM